MAQIIPFPKRRTNLEYVKYEILLEIVKTAIDHDFEIGLLSVWKKHIGESEFPTIDDRMARKDVDLELLRYKEIWRSSFIRTMAKRQSSP